MSVFDSAQLGLVKCLFIAFGRKPEPEKLQLRTLVREFVDSGYPVEILRPAIDRVSATEWQAAEKVLLAAEKRQVEILACFEPGFPAGLREIDHVPFVIFVRGKIPDGTMCAVVGARKATVFGRTFALDIARSLTARGIGVISGLAQGIDAAAHRGAIEGSIEGAIEGRTGPGVAVLGSGVCHIYPRENEQLADDLLAAGGAIISEYELDTPPLNFFFPQRNRIITALSRAVIVVEAQERSGALITARLAAEQGKEVFAVPGSVMNPLASGTNWLLKSGAQVYTGIEDLLSRFPELREECLATEKTGAKKRVGGSLGHLLRILRVDEELAFDTLVEQSGFSSAELAQLLSELELQGRVTQLPGGLYVKC